MGKYVGGVDILDLYLFPSSLRTGRVVRSIHELGDGGVREGLVAFREFCPACLYRWVGGWVGGWMSKWMGRVSYWYHRMGGWVGGWVDLPC